MTASITLSDAITALVAEKRAVGYKYRAEQQVLNRFEAFSRSEFPGLDTLTEASVQAWITAARGRGVEPATLQGLAAPIRELARWLGRRGVTAYLLPAAALPRPARYVPHIYTDQQLAALFQQTDRCRYCCEVPLRHLVMPVLFRTIYACGLRCSEARLLRADDVDIDAGVLQIRDAKGGKDRQVPVSEALRARLAGYHAQVAGQPGRREWFFPADPASTSRSATSSGTSAGFCGRPASLTAGADTAPVCTICAIPSRSTTCGCGSPRARTSARCCRCCKPTWVTRRCPTPPTTCT
jgi:integrase/recombinase XerD